MAAAPTNEILRRPAVTRKTGLASSSLYAAIARGEFPKPIKLGERSVGWLSREVDAWIEARRTQRDESWQSLGDAAARVVEKAGPR
jgi:prophage regulatory protein